MKSSSDKSFGILFFIVFLIIGLWPIFFSEKIRLWSLIISFFFLFIALSKPSILGPLNKIWIRIGYLLGKLIAPIIMSLIFFILVTPISFLVRCFKKDLLSLSFSKEKVSYWNKRKKTIESMDKQY